MAPTPPTTPPTLVERVVAFCSELRLAGLRVNTTTALTAVRAAAAIDVTDREEFFFALQAALTANATEQAVFAGVFAEFWGLPTGEGCGDMGAGGATPGAPSEGGTTPAESGAGQEAGMPGMRQPGGQERDPGAGGPEDQSQSGAAEADAGGDAPEPEPDPWRNRRDAGAPPEVAAGGRRGGASLSEVRAVRVIPPADAAELARLRRVVARLLGPLQYLPAGRARRRRSPGAPDLRRTLRRSLRLGGELLELHFRGKSPSRIDLMAMLDISGSMDTHTEFLLQFMYSMQAAARNVETFVFSTRLSRVTPYLRRGFNTARSEVARRVRHWSGGTRLGDCIKEFNDRWGSGCSGISTVAIIISDGWDRGDPEVLTAELERLKRRVRMLVWVNPLLGVPGYQPLARGLQIAGRYVDAFLPGRDAAALSRSVAVLARR